MSTDTDTLITRDNDPPAARDLVATVTTALEGAS